MTETSSSPSPLAASAAFNEMPLDSLLDVKIHDMSNDELAALVKRAAALRSSAHARNAALNRESAKEKDSVKTSRSRTKKKSSVDKAMDLLNQLTLSLPTQ